MRRATDGPNDLALTIGVITSVVGGPVIPFVGFQAGVTRWELSADEARELAMLFNDAADMVEGRIPMKAAVDARTVTQTEVVETLRRQQS